jgi:phosphatidate cytidylyltransferase
LNGAADTTSSKPAPRKLGRFELGIDWLFRPLFGIALAALAIGAAWDGKWLFALFLGLGSIAAVREWHRMFRRETYARYFVIGTAAIAGALIAQNLVAQGTFEQRLVPWAFLVGGALIDLGIALVAGENPAHAAGPLYVGLTPLSLMLLRANSHGGFWLILAVFIAVWATDTGALICGKLIGGPKLSPRLSPNKTWAGAFGGVLSAIAGVAILFAILRANIVSGALLGLAISVVGQAGDLFESWVKRRVGRKNSGSLIPGHGGVLDRIDSILFVAPVVTLAVLALGFNPMGAP